MKTIQAPHEKLSEEEIKDELTKLLVNHLETLKKWKGHDLGLDEFFYKNDRIIFKLRRHFFPEGTKILRVSLQELCDLMEYVDDSSLKHGEKGE